MPSWGSSVFLLCSSKGLVGKFQPYETIPLCGTLFWKDVNKVKTNSVFVEPKIPFKYFKCFLATLVQQRLYTNINFMLHTLLFVTSKSKKLSLLATVSVVWSAVPIKYHWSIIRRFLKKYIWRPSFSSWVPLKQEERVQQVLVPIHFLLPHLALPLHVALFTPRHGGPKGWNQAQKPQAHSTAVTFLMKQGINGHLSCILRVYHVVATKCDFAFIHKP